MEDVKNSLSSSTATDKKLKTINPAREEVVYEDADIEKVTTGAVKGRFIDCGQSCIASKRFIVTNKVPNEFTEKFVQKTERLKVGDPLSDHTDIGPVVNAKKP